MQLCGVNERHEHWLFRSSPTIGGRMAPRSARSRTSSANRELPSATLRVKASLSWPSEVPPLSFC
jgi:hypothetical protein